jgi:hypothetical protein
MGPLLAGVARDHGVRADSVNVSVALFDPSLVLGRSRQVSLSAANVDLGQGQAGSLKLTLGGVDFFDRTFETVSGELDDVQITLGDNVVSAASASVAGPAGAATVTAHFAGTQVAHLLTVMAAHNGLTLDDVAVTESGVKVTIHGVQATAQLSVRAGALLLNSAIGGNVVLLQPTRKEPWKLTDVWFSPEGMNLSGTVDLNEIVGDMSGAGDVS